MASDVSKAVIAAATTGLMLGALTSCGGGGAQEGGAASPAEAAAEGKACCKGMNECKGQGGCNAHCPK